MVEIMVEMFEIVENVLTSSDDEDEELFNLAQRRPRIFKKRVNLFDTFDDIDFHTRFGLTKNSVLEVLNQIEEVLLPTTERYFIFFNVKKMYSPR